MAWTIRKTRERRLQAAEMKFMRRTAGCSLLEHRGNEDILEKLKIDPVVQYINQYRIQWKGHVDDRNKFCHMFREDVQIWEDLKVLE